MSREERERLVEEGDMLWMKVEGRTCQKQLKCVVISTMDKSRRWKVPNTHLRAESRDEKDGYEYLNFLENKR